MFVLLLLNEEESEFVLYAYRFLCFFFSRCIFALVDSQRYLREILKRCYAFFFVFRFKLYVSEVVVVLRFMDGVLMW